MDAMSLSRGVYFGLTRVNEFSQFKWLDGTSLFQRGYEPPATFDSRGHCAIITTSSNVVQWGSLPCALRTYRLCEKAGSGGALFLCGSWLENHP